ncbi:MAG: hypothetical protein KBA61_02930 [Spirochaetes bacterium]|nr:hypothetical protein [Spirochaetota bacterium]
MKRICDTRQLKAVLKMAIIDRDAMTIRFVDKVSFKVAVDGLLKIRVQVFAEVDGHEPEVAAR